MPRAEPVALSGGDVESLQSLPGALAPVAGVAACWITLGLGLGWAMNVLYFGDSGAQCTPSDAVADGWSPAAQALESAFGALPILLRNFFGVWLLWKVCRKLSGFEDDGAHVARAMLIGRGSTLGVAPAAGWDAIVGNRRGKVGDAAQSTWTQAREARGLTQQQAVASASAKALLWHSSQPLVYLIVLRVYSCYIASLGSVQCYLASVVAAREVIYLASIALGIWQSSVFLLLDPVTAWNEAGSWLEGTVRIAMYVLTPHNYVAFSLANRLRAWRRTFLGLAAVQIVADFASCFALATLMAGGISTQKDTPTALIIGYIITAFGFLLFFGPLSVASSLRGGMDQAKSRWLRCMLTVAGISLLLALSYIVFLFVLLISGTDIFCRGWTFQSDPCNGHGECYAAAQCHCEPGFGPELSYSGEPLCSWHGTCTASQLQRAVAQRDEAACGGPRFPGSRLLTPEWGENLTRWVGGSMATDEWTLCYSSFTDDATTPTAFHTQCDAYSATLSVVHNAGGDNSAGSLYSKNAGNYTFGGFATGSWSKEACCADPRNDCQSHSYECCNRAASHNFLFGLWMPDWVDKGPQRFLPTGYDSSYQLVHQPEWPMWGSWNGWGLWLGFTGSLGGTHGSCSDPGDFHSPYETPRYPGAPICGWGNWGATQLEVWRPACTDCGGHGACDRNTRVCMCSPGYRLANPATCVFDPCYENSCSGHGNCEPFTGACVCQGGWMGLDCSVASSSSFPGSRLISTESEKALIDWVSRSVPEGQWTQCYSSFTDDATSPRAFHAQCDAYNATVSVVRNAGNGGSNAGNYTFGGFAAGSWNKEACCADPRNDCSGHPLCNGCDEDCIDHASSDDFLFGLWMPGRVGGEGPKRFVPTGKSTVYQTVRLPEVSGSGDRRVHVTAWPSWGLDEWGSSQLSLGRHSQLGAYNSASCGGGQYYNSSSNEICGGWQNWGATELEVWRPVCTSCSGHGTCDRNTHVCACAVGYRLANPATCVSDDQYYSRPVDK